MKIDDRGQSGMLMWTMFVVITLFLFFTLYTLLFGYWQQFFDLGVTFGANATIMGDLERNMAAAPFIFALSIFTVFIFYALTRG